MNALKVTHGLILDFTLSGAGGNDVFLLGASDGTVKSLASVPVARVSGGGNLTEATSSVLTITGGSSAVLTSGLTIQVKLAATGQSGYISSTDWNTFNNKLGTALTSANVFVGNGSAVATGVAITGDIGITNAGVTSISSGVIVNADVNASAAIALSKLAALSTNLVTATNGSGFITTIAGFTTTIAGYFTGITSAVQTQIDGKLSVTLTSPASGDVITYNGSAWVNSATGSGTLPIGGTANQFLTKINSTNYNTQWHTLVAADVTDVTSSAAELNKLTGVTTTTAQFNYLNTSTSDVQVQLNNKLSTALSFNSIWVGNGANIATPLIAGTETYVLTINGGSPSWLPPSGGISGLTSPRIPFASSATTLADNAFLTWDNTNGFLGIGPSTIDRRLHVELDNATTNAVAFLQRLTKTTSGTAAAGLGVGVEFEIENGSGTNRISGTIQSIYNRVTDTQESADMYFYKIGFGAQREGLIITEGQGGQTDTMVKVRNLGVGSSTTATYTPLIGLAGIISDHLISNSNNNSVDPVLRLSKYTASPAIGIGVSLQFATETATTTNAEIGATIAAVTTNVTGTTEAYDLTFNLMNAGATAAEKMRITAAGNIYGTSGTTSMTDGFFYIPSAAGIPSGTPTAISGRLPMYYDSTNNQFYVYNGSWRKVALT